jgi:uncharacterized membrane protein
MRSEAARVRALKRGPGAGGFLLAHHGPGHLDRCYQVWLGRKPIWLCARCVGVYPVLLAMLSVQLVAGYPPSSLDWLWLFVFPLPALVDWFLARLGFRPGNNVGRTATGVLLGLSLGRMIYLNMIEPFQSLVLVQLTALTGVVVLVELVARWVMPTVHREDGGTRQ